MTCVDFQNNLSAYLDRELAELDSTLMAAHAETCARCQKARTLYLDMKTALRERRMPGMPPDLLAAIEEQTLFRKSWWESDDRFGARWLPALVGVATAAGALWLSRVQTHAHPAGPVSVAVRPAPLPEVQQVFLPHPEESSPEKGERREHQKS